MGLAIDFGTCNTVIARRNEADGAVETVRLGELSRIYEYSIPGDPAKRQTRVVPSLIHYGDGNRLLLGDQVCREGELDNPATFRWTKLNLLHNDIRSKRVGDRRIAYRQASTDFLKNILTFALGSLRISEKELICTYPVEAFDHYTDWLLSTASGVFDGRVRLLDEATACILGCTERVPDGSIVVIFDFGGGTLDVSVVKVNFGAAGTRKCEVLGKAGEEIGGMKIDSWMLEHFLAKGKYTNDDIQGVGMPLMNEIEEAKIKLSSGTERVPISRFNDLNGKTIRGEFTQDTLRGILKANNFLGHVVGTIDRALDIAQDKHGVRRGDIGGIFVVGGTSLLLDVIDSLKVHFHDKRLYCSEPFEAIARGACRYTGEGIPQPLVHDYCLKSWNRTTLQFEYETVLPKGTNFPTGGPVMGKAISGAIDYAETLGFIIYEKSEMSLPGTTVMVGEDGQVRMVEGERKREERILPVNPEHDAFLFPEPACELDQRRRFIAGFGLDEHKRLTVSLKDTLPGNSSYIMNRGAKVPLPVKDYPLVKL